MNVEQSLKHDVGVTLFDLIQFIWSGKWTVIGVSFFTSIITIIYLMVSPATYEGELEIFPVSPLEVSKYRDLNNSKFINKCATGAEDTNINCNFISSEKLLKQFVDDLRTYKSIEESIRKNLYLKKNNNETDLAFSFRIKKYARKFRFSKSENPNSVGLLKDKYLWTVSFTTGQPDLVVKILSDAMSASNNSISIQIGNELDSLITYHSTNIKEELEDLDISSKTIIRKTGLERQARLIFLNEQKSIAKTLGIEKSLLLQRANSLGSLPETYIDEGTIPYYFSGDVAIEKEIEILSSRDPSLLLTDELIDNEIRRIQLLQDKALTRFQGVVSLTPIGKDSFNAVFYDLASIEVKNQINQKLLLVISIILGGILGIFALIIRKAFSLKAQA